MPSEDFHLSDQELLLAVDGELSGRDHERVQTHLAACWTCRTRRQEIEGTICEFMRVHRQSLNVHIPPADGPRALLKARMAELAETQRTSWLQWVVRTTFWRLSVPILAVLCLLAVPAYFTFGTWAGQPNGLPTPVYRPDPRLTPGATVLVSRGEVCKEPNTNNKPVPIAMQRRVFDEYRIHTAKLSAYEVDYLITPALGGADDIHNLWPQSKEATLWNAHVKDALEDHLRDLVCEGQVDLATAQREMAYSWIEAYKKYFHTDRPLPETH